MSEEITRNGITYRYSAHAVLAPRFEQMKVWLKEKLSDGEEHLYQPLLDQYNALCPGWPPVNVGLLPQCHDFEVIKERGTVRLISND